MYEVTEKILREVRKVIVGKDDVVEKVWISILAQGHVLLEDVPGVGKTTMALAFSKALGLETKRVQFTPDTMPSDIIGFSLPEQGRMVYQPGAVMTNLLLADEINRTSSKTQSALLEAMEEGHVTVDGVTHDLPAPFVVLATQNPIGSAGTQNLPNSQLDRFLMKLSMGYPDVGSQVRILRERSQQEPLEQVEPVMRREELIAAIARVRQVHVDDQIYDYIARLAEVTRTHPLLKLGISPRGALALCRAAAGVDGRVGLLIELAVDVALAQKLRLELLILRHRHELVEGVLPHLGVLHDGFQHIEVVVFLVFHTKIPLLRVVSLKRGTLMHYSPS